MMAHSTDERNILASSIYERLKERIMDQVTRPGSRLNIDALSVELDVSPTPVREALARLAAERLVTFEPFKGYSVNPLMNPRQVADLMHVRRLIEVDAVCLAAPRIQTPDLIAIKKILTESELHHVGSWSEGYRAFNQLDQKYHEALVAASGNPHLLDTYRSLNIHVQLGRFYDSFSDQDQATTCTEHRAVYEALSRHDAEGAARAVESHLSNTEIRVFEQ
jgi:DNA-binding GntR family transcriptional regulator